MHDSGMSELNTHGCGAQLLLCWDADVATLYSLQTVVAFCTFTNCQAGCLQVWADDDVVEVGLGEQ